MNQKLDASSRREIVSSRWRGAGHVLRFGITENLANFNNTPDVGVNLSVARILFAAPR